ncbi:MAG: hypothetical protein HY520_01105 [Candidatus Aenigmarchaeota archaeon]|nr:hypothetical protein [Candidatus Aenigmarchaeota archaeon]
MRGFWFMVEAALGGIILMAVVGFLVSSSFSAEEDDLTVQGYRLLHGLNRQGLLKSHAMTDNFTAINDLIVYTAASHAVQVCSLEACAGDRPQASNVWVASYVVPGQDRFHPREVRLYLYR